MIDHYGELGPETAGSEQFDEVSQAHTVADEVLHGSRVGSSPTESSRVKSGLDDNSTQDLVDHMRDMESSGRIDMGAFAGEPNHDDNAAKYGPGSKRGVYDDDELFEDDDS